ncbi:transketolase [Streptomyces varsoviensis]|uniref:transketolase n=1 Tax=Streptomyces varsoviensis TaxID=67373 RepID=UPI0009983EA8|nr:1-deoxy-D-xylulose-5-phosphate synthase N-terminal domain-containing protein [Streptomyces varsoviensis]
MTGRAGSRAVTDDRPPAGAARPAETARRARARLLGLAASRPVHLGASLSVVEILVCAFATMRHDPRDLDRPDRDRLILSKGHGVWGLYSVLAELGVAGLDEPRAGHPIDGTPGVEAATGALGHGLSIGAGLAEAARLDAADRRTLVVLGDGELDEGSVWEAAMFAAHRRLNTLIAVVDRNGMQQEGGTEAVLALEPLAAKWAAFGWRVIETDGHDCAALTGALRTARTPDDRPSVVLARTVKARGVAFMEGSAAWHYGQLDEEQLTAALAALAAGERGA